MNEIIFEVEDAPEGGYTARALSASIYTEADGFAELREAVRDAVRCHFDDGEAPAIIRLHYVTTHQRGEHHFAESVTDPQARERLLDAIGGSGAFGRFKRVLSSYPDLREQWFRFQEDRLGEYAREWLAEENIDAELTGPRK